MSSDKSDKRPNILIFMTDHQRGDTVLPTSGAIMPNVTDFRSEGITFTQAYTPTPHCCPARAAFFSGLYPSRSGIWNNVLNGQALSVNLKPGVRLFSEYLKNAGYNLGFSGKWHVSGVEFPRDRGWDELFVSAAPGGRHSKDWDMIRKDADYIESCKRSPGEIVQRGYGREILYGRNDAGNKHDEEAVDRAVQAIRDFGKEGKPWVIFVGAYMPHAPYFVPQKYLDMYRPEDIPLPGSYNDDLKDKPNYYRKLREMRFGQLSEEEVKDGIRHYWAMCTYLDELFGRLLAVLEDTAQKDNTFVLYCSDHGDYLGEHGLFHKGVPSFRGAYHIPAVVRWPDGIRNPGRMVDEFISLADFAPTFLDIAGVEEDIESSAMSLVPFLRGEKPDNWRDTMFAQCNGVENYFTQRIVFNRDFKYVYNGFDYDEFYDLRDDPDEMLNRINEPGYDDVKRDLLKKLWAFAYREDDQLALSQYIMVNTAPWGPAELFRD